MPHITFIHGIENKPSAERLKELWCEALAADGGLNLAELGVTVSMVYWADVLYESPLTEAILEMLGGVAAESLVESLAESPGSVVPAPTPEIVQDLGAAASESSEKARFLAGVAGKFSIAWMRMSAGTASPAEFGGIEERIPLPWAVKEPLMANLLRDVHHYLFNEEFSPRPGVSFRVRDEIRRRFVDVLRRASPVDGRHVVVSHSMGTVIAYDCLLRVEDCPKIDGLMTVGSPLGLDEIQDQMAPEWSRRNGFPGRKLDGEWVNVYDRLDPVAGFDPNLANDFRRNGERVVTDISEPNHGWWRHDIAKYLRGPKLRKSLADLLAIPHTEAVSPQTLSATNRKNERWVSAATVESIVEQVRGAVSRGSESTLFESTQAAHSTDGRDDFDVDRQIDDALRTLRESAAEDGPRVMSSPPHQLASLLQSAVQRTALRKSVPQGLEFAFDRDDVRRRVADALQQAAKGYQHPPLRPSKSAVERLPKSARVFLVSDFGTGLYGAPNIARSAREQGKFDLLLHLGDIYYSGQPDEVRSRFLDLWPTAAGRISRSLNGNHDMYSGGYGYFDVLLPAFGQDSSYFAFQNKHWLLVGLDTAYRDEDLDRKQRRWLEEIVDRAGGRKLILFSHHPLFSNFKKPGRKLEKRLGKLLESRRITAWYWGHEHHAVIYQAHPEYGLLARCLGNGGMPANRKDLAGFPVVRTEGKFSWRHSTTDKTPPGDYLDGPNEFIKADPDGYGPHGYMTLDFDDASLIEKVFTAGGQEVYCNKIS
jgi:predicted phosphodiesterase